MSDRKLDCPKDLVLAPLNFLLVAQCPETFLNTKGCKVLEQGMSCRRKVRSLGKIQKLEASMAEKS